MGKKPKVFQNKIDRRINNNKKIFDSGNSNLINDTFLRDNSNNNMNLTVIDKINSLLNKNGYIFNIPVKIITSNKVFNTFIASVINDNLITLDNDIISLNEVIDIEY